MNSFLQKIKRAFSSFGRSLRISKKNSKVHTISTIGYPNKQSNEPLHCTNVTQQSPSMSEKSALSVELSAFYEDVSAILRADLASELPFKIAMVSVAEIIATPVQELAAVSIEETGLVSAESAAIPCEVITSGLTENTPIIPIEQSVATSAEDIALVLTEEDMKAPSEVTPILVFEDTAAYAEEEHNVTRSEEARISSTENAILITTEKTVEETFQDEEVCMNEDLPSDEELSLAPANENTVEFSMEPVLDSVQEQFVENTENCFVNEDVPTACDNEPEHFTLQLNELIEENYENCTFEIEPIEYENSVVFSEEYDENETEDESDDERCYERRAYDPIQETSSRQPDELHAMLSFGYQVRRPFILLKMADITDTCLKECMAKVLSGINNDKIIVRFNQADVFYCSLLSYFLKNNFRFFNFALFLSCNNTFPDLLNDKKKDPFKRRESAIVTAFSFRALQCLQTLMKPSDNFVELIANFLEANLMFWLLLKFQCSYPRCINFVNCAKDLINALKNISNVFAKKFDTSLAVRQFREAYVCPMEIERVLEFAKSALTIFVTYPKEFCDSISDLEFVDGFEYNKWLLNTIQGSLDEMNSINESSRIKIDKDNGIIATANC